ncbi:tetratricopeptide repeat-containing sulfotransferase family protein [Hyphococcus lacteus]|uniref:Sulfotransferase n=1 Tax=Hyphococcus lacteus TaxID=3143536 RepID=A0ABV3Z3H5_9PROT
MTQPPSQLAKLREADGLLRQRKATEAAAICSTLLDDDPDNTAALLIRARSSQMRNDLNAMLADVQTVLRITPDHRDAALMEIEGLIAKGQISKAKSRIEIGVENAGNDAVYIARLAEMQTLVGDFQSAAMSLRKAFSIEPDNAAIIYNLANAELSVGAFTAAEQCYDHLIGLRPNDYDAYYNRATLRRQSKDNNHIEELKRALESARGNVNGVVQVCYALAKEHEDLEQYAEGFDYLKRGADTRKQNLSYRVEDDIETIRLLSDRFNKDYFSKTQDGYKDFSPIFIVGLPRSGTTLTDRILSSHPRIDSVGEVNDFALAMTRLCGAVSSKMELVQRSTEISMQDLGQAYATALRNRTADADFIIDKTPLNFLYIGLIAKALPNAKIIHVMRDNMDVGFAMYKTLFRMGYPFSYDLTDIARYILAKDAMMDHWRAVLSGRIIDVGYEDLVARQEEESRRLIAEIGIDWDPACLEFDKNKTATATASAAQVRSPVYNSSVGKWKHYEEQLQPLALALGIANETK